jgi:hypothetical protein
MKAYQIERPATAFSLSTGKKKRPRKENEDHLKWIRTLPCLVSGKRPVDAAHVRYADPRYGKREVGGQEKPDDRWAVPLHRSEHDKQHSGDERSYWSVLGIDPCQVALALSGMSGDDEAAEVILLEARRGMKGSR